MHSTSRRREIHLAALRAARAVASVASVASVTSMTSAVSGCQTPIEEPARPPEATRTSAPVTKPGVALSCDAVVAGAFPEEGDYPGAKKDVSADVQRCCAELLEAHEKGGTRMLRHRWDCCANVESAKSSHLGIACTPWGPPVPPPMRVV